MPRRHEGGKKPSESSRASSKVREGGGEAVLQHWSRYSPRSLRERTHAGAGEKRARRKEGPDTTPHSPSPLPRWGGGRGAGNEGGKLSLGERGQVLKVLCPFVSHYTNLF